MPNALRAFCFEDDIASDELESLSQALDAFKLDIFAGLRRLDGALQELYAFQHPVPCI